MESLTALVMQGEFKDSQSVDLRFAHNTPCGKKKIKEALSVARDGNVPVDYSYLGAHRRPGHGAGQPGMPVSLVAVAWLSDGPGGHLRGPGTLNDEIAVKYDEKGYLLNNLRVTRAYPMTHPAQVAWPVP